MALNEFSLIEKYFSPLSISRGDVLLGIGDDAAITTIPTGKQLAITTDTLVAGVHFLSDWSARDIAYKSLAVNLSDLAAMGAEPAWVSLALTLPEANELWLADFAAGFQELLQQYNVQLIGGDTTQGPLTITITVHGFINPNFYLRRDAAKVGDMIYITGELGAAAIAVKNLKENSLSAADQAVAMQALLRPQAKIKEGLALASMAHAAIDISDGLAADLNHILNKSSVAARIDLEKIPVATVCLSNLAEFDARLLALTGGDDYQLCFTAAANQQAAIAELARQLDCPMTAIGVIEQGTGLCCQWQGKELALPLKGYEHFR